MTSQSLEPPTERTDESDGSDEDAGRATAAMDGDRRVTLPDDATDAEAAAIVAAIGAHLRDRERAAAARAAAAGDSVDHVDRWTLAARLGDRGHRRLPREVERGDVWRAASRSL